MQMECGVRSFPGAPTNSLCWKLNPRQLNQSGCLHILTSITIRKHHVCSLYKILFVLYTENGNEEMTDLAQTGDNTIAIATLYCLQRTNKWLIKY